MTRHRWMAGARVALASGMVLLGCQLLTDPLSEPPDMEGTVSWAYETTMWLTDVRYHSWDVDECAPTTHCHCDPGESCPRKAGIRFQPGTEFYIMQSGRLRKSSEGAIEVGDHVQVWVRGGEARSDPPQYGGYQVVIWRLQLR